MTELESNGTIKEPISASRNIRAKRRLVFSTTPLRQLNAVQAPTFAPRSYRVPAPHESCTEAYSKDSSPAQTSDKNACRDASSCLLGSFTPPQFSSQCSDQSFLAPAWL